MSGLPIVLVLSGIVLATLFPSYIFLSPTVQSDTTFSESGVQIVDQGRRNKQ